MNVLEKLESIAAAIAPELESLYVLEQPDAWPTPSNSAAYAIGPNCSAQQREWLISQNRWAGWGPAIIFPGGVCDSQECVGLFLHELAHCLPTSPRPDLPPSDLEWVVHLARFTEFAEYVPPAEPWLSHEWQFIRRGLHLWSRAVNCCHLPVSPRDLRLSGANYGTSDVNEYAAALGDEPYVLRDATFKDIEATTPPIAFVELFEADKQRWHKEKEAA